MLVLSRRQSETIVIGDNIRVQVLEISGGRVRLAIEAPGNVSVDREENLGAGSSSGRFCKKTVPRSLRAAGRPLRRGDPLNMDWTRAN